LLFGPSPQESMPAAMCARALCLVMLVQVAGCLRIGPGANVDRKAPKIGFDEGSSFPTVRSKWARPGVDDFTERLESLKAGVIGAVAASVGASLPGFFVEASVAQWEFTTDMAALTGFLFAVVYRYAVREDPNPQLRTGVIGAFAITRLLARVEVPDYCTPIPLSCGPPLGYFDYTMLQTMFTQGISSFAAFGAAAIALDAAVSLGYLKPFPSRS